MPTEALVHLNDLLSRISSAEAAIDEARHRIESDVNALSSHFATGPWDEEIPEIDPHALTHALEAGLGPATALSDRLGAMAEHASGTIDQVRSAIETATAAWESAYHQTEQSAGQFTAALAGEGQSIAAALQQLKQHLHSADANWAAAQTKLDALISTFGQTIGHDLTTDLTGAAESFLHDLTDTQAHAVEEHLNQARDIAEKALDELARSATEMLHSFQEQLDQALHHLADHVSHDIHQRLEEGLREIIDATVQRIFETITEAVVGSELGLAVTGMMEPVLPELIAIKKLTDVILQAIRLWHDTIGRMTSLGGLFG